MSSRIKPLAVIALSVMLVLALHGAFYLRVPGLSWWDGG
jgi:hypothetical protein